jgi:hypothetical protein
MQRTGTVKRAARKRAWRGLTTRSISAGRLHVIAYRATLDIPRELAQFVSKLLADERRRRGTPRGSRALNCFWQAVLGLRWFRDRTSPEALARDHGISRATAYRYVDEVIAVLADEAPDLRQALERAMQEGYSHVILDGTIGSAARPGRPRSPKSPSCCGSTGSAEPRRHPQRQPSTASWTPPTTAAPSAKAPDENGSSPTPDSSTRSPRPSASTSTSSTSEFDDN